MFLLVSKKRMKYALVLNNFDIKFVVYHSETLLLILTKIYKCS